MIAVLRRDTLVWGPAWLCLTLAGVLEFASQRVPPLEPAGAFFATLFPFMMLVGALRYAGREDFGRVLAFGAVVGGVRAALHGAALPKAAETIALAVDPTALAAAGWIAFAFARRERSRLPDLLIGPALGLLASVEAYGGLRQLVQEEAADWGIWAAVVFPTAVIQVYASIDHNARQRADALRTLRDTTERFRRVSEHSQDLISEVGPDGRFTYVSPNHSILGVTEEDMLGRRIGELPYVMQVEAEGSPPEEGTYDSLTKVRVADGGVRWFEARSTATLGDEGERFVLTISRDVTDRVLADEARRADQNRLATLLSSLPKTRVSLIDRDRVLRSLVPDRNVVERYGVRWEDAEGQPLDRFVPPEDVERWQALIEQVLATRSVQRVRQEVGLGDAKLWYDTILSPFPGDDGDVVLAVSQDVTEQVRAEEERRDFELRLQQAQKFESLGLLASGVAHDFNNLLVGIRGNVALAARSIAKDSELAPRLGDIDSAAQRAAELTEQLLAYAGKADLHASAVDLAVLVEDTAQLLRAGVSRTAELVFEAGESRPWVSGDRTQIGQVVMNLIMNAGEAVGNPGGRVVVRTGVMNADSGYLGACHPMGASGPGEYSFVEVEDSGPGMSQETVARVFEPFFSSHGLGRGLGLAVVLGIVKSHGGTVRVDSELGRGTRFRVLFPPTAPGAPQEPAEEGIESPPGSGTILLVDDEDGVRRVARQFLEIGGFDVIEASRGADAVDLFRDRPEVFQAVILDVSMPGMDGPATLAALRELRDDLPAVFMSGHSARDIARVAEGSARTGRVRKPFGITDLQNAIRDVLAGDAAQPS